MAKMLSAGQYRFSTSSGTVGLFQYTPLANPVVLSPGKTCYWPYLWSARFQIYLSNGSVIVAQQVISPRFPDVGKTHARRF